MLLQDSPVAKAVRDNLLNLVEHIIPAQSSTPELPSVRERLEVIEFGTNLLDRLGGADERTRLALKDQVRDILLEDKLQSTALPVSHQSALPVSYRSTLPSSHQPALPGSDQLALSGSNQLTLLGTERLEWPISDRARHLGYNPNRKQLLAIGKMVAPMYRARHNGENPPKREQFVDGTTRPVNCYGTADLDIVDRGIEAIMGVVGRMVQPHNAGYTTTHSFHMTGGGFERTLPIPIITLRSKMQKKSLSPQET